MDASSDRVWLQHYPPGVPPTLDIPDRSLVELVQESVLKHPDRLAFIYYGAKWTYRRFWEAAGHLAQSLLNEGLQRGDRVALYLPNCPVYPIAYFAALRAGMTVVQVSPLYIGQDLHRLLEDAQPKAIFTLNIQWPNLEKLSWSFAEPLTYVVGMNELYPLPTRLFVNRVLARRKLSSRIPEGARIRRWKPALATPGMPAPVRVNAATEVAVLQYTGGTTGLPKAAMLSHRNLVANALQCQAWFNVAVQEREVVLASIPYFHVYGMTVAMTYPLLAGATIVLQTQPDVNEILKLINKYHPTQFPGVPALYNGINHNPKRDNYDLRSIRICLSGSAPLPLEVAKKFEAETGGSLVEGYGLSETSPVTHANPIRGERRAGSVGLPMPGTDQRVVDLVTGTTVLPPMEPGELCIRGPQVMLGYYHQPEETAAVLADGWFKTGDIAYIDADGYCFIVDRKKDLINVGGFKVYPREVEEVLFQHPGVADAAVVGVPDAEHGEVVRAFVAKKPGATVTAEELIQFVRERLAHYKAPRLVEFRTALPRSGVQKVLRRELRAQAGAETTVAPLAAVPVTGPG
ncbi:MAG: long-chain fatty acid--CoA ligase [Thermoplasmata archaeon]